MKVNKEFYERDARVVAQELLGKILVRKVNNTLLKGKIVETEAYIGEIDKACHAYGGKRTVRTEPLYGEAGIAYVYFVYGMYYCFNVITNKKDIAEGVLIRGVEPLKGGEVISNLRFKKSHESLSNKERKNLTNGPSKLCMAFNITKEQNKMCLWENETIYIEEPEKNFNLTNVEIVKAKRIGIDYAKEAKDFLWRFYIKNNEYVSKK